MAIEINKIYDATFEPEGKKHYVDIYISVILKNAPYYEPFGVHHLFQEFYTDRESSLRINELSEIIKKELLRLGVVERYGSWQYIIIPEIRDDLRGRREVVSSSSSKGPSGTLEKFWNLASSNNLIAGLILLLSLLFGLL
ncbi:MAG TPA: hypothetical protein VF581_07935 [Flavobacterium sp.]|jgi:hypothetical protein